MQNRKKISWGNNSERTIPPTEDSDTEVEKTSDQDISKSRKHPRPHVCWGLDPVYRQAVREANAAHKISTTKTHPMTLRSDDVPEVKNKLGR